MSAIAASILSSIYKDQSVEIMGKVRTFSAGCNGEREVAVPGGLRTDQPAFSVADPFFTEKLMLITNKQAEKEQFIPIFYILRLNQFEKL
ncbi:hypothetical protein GCM10009415_28800 [Chitinophaga japonensis]